MDFEVKFRLYDRKENMVVDWIAPDVGPSASVSEALDKAMKVKDLSSFVKDMDVNGVTITRPGTA